MARFAVIGDPVAHSLSPAMHEAAYRALSLDHSYEAIRVAPGEVVASLEQLKTEGFAGVNVTVPYKEEALGFGSPDEFCLRARAVNTIDLRSGVGINTDAPGFLSVLSSRQIGARVLMLGAGGSARALTIALVEAGYLLAIWNRTPERAAELAALCGGRAVKELELKDFDVVVNATSASLTGDLPSPVALASPSVAHAGLAIDLYYTDGPTPYMRAMSAQGWTSLDGRELLVAQGALAFTFWLGVPAPIEAMRTAVGL
jgi:shikimate dehydrogenase